MKKISLLLLSLLMCFMINITAYAEEDYTIISGGDSKETAVTLNSGTTYVTSVNGITNKNALYFKFTTPAKKGIYNIYLDETSNTEKLNCKITNSIDENIFWSDFVTGDSGYDLRSFKPSTTYYVIIYNSDSSYANSGYAKFRITYTEDFGNDEISTSTQVSLDTTYNGLITGKEDLDWFKFNTGKYTDFTISTANIGDNFKGCVCDCPISVTLTNEINEQLAGGSLSIGEDWDEEISLLPNKTYFLSFEHIHYPPCNHFYTCHCHSTCSGNYCSYYGFSDAYQFSISPVRTPISSTSIGLSSTSYTYDGKAKTPAITIKYAGKTLTKGVDYKVEYSNNTATGIGKVTITGIGNYKGTVTKTFQIKPKKLTGLKQSWRTTSSVTLTWKALSGVTGYQIYRKDSSNGSYKYVGSTTSTKYINKSLTAGKTYYYLVRGYKKSGTTTITGKKSDTITTTTTPGQVKALKVDKNSTNYITLKWNKLTGATGYYIYRKDSSNGSFKYLGATTRTSYTNKKLTSGKNYYYVVVGYKKFNSKTLKGAKSGVLQATTRPKAPTLKGFASTKSSTLTWSKVTGASGYEVYMSTSKNGTYNKIATIGGTSSKIATIGSTSIIYKKASLTSGKTYYFKVRSYTTGKSGAKVYSYKYSPIVAVKVK